MRRLAQNYVVALLLIYSIGVCTLGQTKAGGGAKFGGVIKAGTNVAGGGSLNASWHLSDTSDSSGNGNTLTNNGSATFGAGKIGNAVTLNGSSQYLSIASNAFVNPGDTDWGFGFWFKPGADGGGNMHLFSKMDGATAATFNLTWNDTANTLKFEIFNDAFSTVGSVTVVPAFASGTWYCITGKVDAVNNRIKLRVNDGVDYGFGVVNGDEPTTDAMTDNGSVPFTIGAKDDTGDRGWVNGQIDAFVIVPEVWDSTEESTFYNSGTGIELP